LFILDKCFAASHEGFKQDIFQGRARPSLGVVHRYINIIKKRERRPEPQARSARHATLRRWVLPVRSRLGSTLAVGFYPFVIGLTLRRWVLPHATLRRWVLPVRSWLGSTPSSLVFVAGSYPSSLGLTLRRWALTFVVGSYASSLVPIIRRWALPFVVGPYHSSLGPTIRR